MAQETLTAFKALFGKPHTSPQKTFVQNELLNIGVQTTSDTVFGEKLTALPPAGQYAYNGVVEQVRLELDPILGTESDAGIHGFAARLSSDYQNNSVNPKAGFAPFINNQVLEATRGAVQVVGESVGGLPYAVTLLDSSLNVISPLDEREWVAYASGGILYQKNPPANPAFNPAYIDCWIYTGKSALDSQTKEYVREEFTLTATNITNASVALADTPDDPDSTSVTVDGAPTLNRGDSWDVSGSQIVWGGLALDGVLEIGEKLFVKYVK